MLELQQLGTIFLQNYCLIKAVKQYKPRIHGTIHKYRMPFANKNSFC